MYFCRATNSARSSEILRSPSFPGSIFYLNWIIVTVRKICPNNSFFTQLLSLVFLPSAVLQSNYHKNLIEQCMIYKKMLVVFLAFIFYIFNSTTKLFLLPSEDVSFLTDTTTVLVYQNCHFTEQQEATSELCLPLIPHWPHPPNTGMYLKCSQTTASTTMCITHNI